MLVAKYITLTFLILSSGLSDITDHHPPALKLEYIDLDDLIPLDYEYPTQIKENEKGAENFLKNRLNPYRYTELGFFCKIDVKLEQKVGLPVRFRLGTADYVDRLEGKLPGIDF